MQPSLSRGPSTTNTELVCSASCENPASPSPVGAETCFPFLPMASWFFPPRSPSPPPPCPPEILATALPPVPSASPRLPRDTTGSSLAGPWQAPLPTAHPAAPPAGGKRAHCSCLSLPPLCVSVLVFLLSAKLPGWAFSSAPPFPPCFYPAPCLSPSQTPFLPTSSSVSNLSLAALETIYFNRYIP